jgi:hypothetical protein
MLRAYDDDEDDGDGLDEDEMEEQMRRSATEPTLLASVLNEAHVQDNKKMAMPDALPLPPPMSLLTQFAWSLREPPELGPQRERAALREARRMLRRTYQNFLQNKMGFVIYGPPTQPWPPYMDNKDRGPERLLPPRPKYIPPPFDPKAWTISPFPQSPAATSSSAHASSKTKSPLKQGAPPSSTGKLPQMPEAMRDSRTWAKKREKMPSFLRDVYGEIEARDQMLKGRGTGAVLRDPLWALARPAKVGSMRSRPLPLQQKPERERQRVVVAVPRTVNRGGYAESPKGP